MERAENLANRALQRESARQKEQHSPKSSDEKLLIRLWARMGHIYGHRWTASFGETAMADGQLSDVAKTWGAGLRGLTGEQIASGLRACCERADGWPPTLPEFRALCVNRPCEIIGGQYVPAHRPPLFERSRLLSSTDREARRSSARACLSQLKKSLTTRCL